MKKVFALVSVLALACSTAAFADEEIKQEPLDPGGDEPNSVPCVTEGYKQYSVTADLAVPDNNTTGVSSTQTITETGAILDVVVGVEMNHSWIGDLVAGLSFQPACGGPTIGPVNILCRQNRTNCTGQGTPFGCSINLTTASDYEWSDAATAEAGEPCPTGTNLASGCFLPDNDNVGALPFSVFDGLDKAGCWTLRIQDMGGGDTGTLVSWTLSLNNEVVLTEACCYPDGSCADVPPADCTAGGGLPQGAGTVCATTVCVNAVESKTWGGVKGLFR
jgi:hypothetical protein